MTVERLYAAALTLYPFDYRVRFGAEMRAAFSAAVRDRRSAGFVPYFTFVISEAVGLVGAALRDRAMKLVADPVSRARVLPDCRLIRRVGVTRAEWASGLDDAD